MSLPRATNRKVSENVHNDKTNSDKKKHASRSNGTKNETHGKTETTSGNKKIRRQSTVAEHTKAERKTELKKHTSIDVHTKSTHTGKFL